MDRKDNDAPQELPQDRPCFVCRKPFLCVAGQSLCADCTEEAHETLAKRLDPTYDVKAMNEWERCATALWRLYGRLEYWDEQRERGMRGEML